MTNSQLLMQTHIPSLQLKSGGGRSLHRKLAKGGGGGGWSSFMASFNPLCLSFNLDLTAITAEQLSELQPCFFLSN